MRGSGAAPNIGNGGLAALSKHFVERSRAAWPPSITLVGLCKAAPAARKFSPWSAWLSRRLYRGIGRDLCRWIWPGCESVWTCMSNRILFGHGALFRHIGIPSVPGLGLPCRRLPE